MATTSSTNRLPRRKRLDLRATDRQRELIIIVAKHQGMSVTDFILKSSCEQAEQILSNQQHFALPKNRWNAFIEALDRPIQQKPRLQRLLSHSSILDDT